MAPREAGPRRLRPEFAFPRRGGARGSAAALRLRPRLTAAPARPSPPGDDGGAWKQLFFGPVTRPPPEGPRGDGGRGLSSARPAPAAGGGNGAEAKKITDKG